MRNILTDQIQYFYRCKIGTRTEVCMQIMVYEDDPTRISVQALIIAVNALLPKSYGEMGYYMQEINGRYFYQQLPFFTLKNEGEIIVVRGNEDHCGYFDDVLFVVDRNRHPLSDLTYDALMGAYIMGYTSVALMPLRTEVSLFGYVQLSYADILLGTAQGFDVFKTEYPKAKFQINLFVSRGYQERMREILRTLCIY